MLKRGGLTCVCVGLTLSVTDSASAKPPPTVTNGTVDQRSDDSQPRGPAGMALIPGGEFQMGDHHDGMMISLPVHAVYVDAFHMDVYEVTNQQYVDALNCIVGCRCQNNNRRIALQMLCLFLMA